MTITINGTTGIAGVDGSASTPAVQGTDTNTGIFYPAADTIAFAEGGAEVMRINSSGYVGIGTTSPGSPLSVLSSISTAQGIYRNTDVSVAGAAGVTLELGALVGTTPTPAAQIVTVLDDANSGNMRFGTRSSGTVTERARINSAGYFKASNNATYIGSTGSYHEFNSTADGSNIEFRSTSATFSSGGQIFFSVDRNTTNNTFYYLGCYNYGASSYRLRIADSGNVTNVNGTYGTISDAKLKQDITDATPQWDDIKNLRFRKYRLKSEVELDPNAKPFLGLVAQEAELVCPGLVEEHTDRDREDNDLGTTTKSIKTSILYMKAVKALQEAMARIEILEAQNAAFEARLAALEAN